MKAEKVVWLPERTQRIRLMKKIAFLAAHPAHLWVLRPVAEYIREFAEVVWVVRDKDCVVSLADEIGLEYYPLTKAATGFLGNGMELARATLSAIRLTHQLKIDVWVSKYGAGNIAARLCRRRAVAYNDDDADVVPLVARASYTPSIIALATDVTRMGHYERKTVRFPGYFELCYLHPNRFTPDRSVYADLGIKEGAPYAILRLSSLEAHHDVGIRGIEDSFIRRIITMAGDEIRIFINSEKPIPREFQRYQCPIPVHRIHHALAFAEFLVGDGQTMASEAAVLGTPAFRLNDFVGRLSYLEDLEKYGLAFGFLPGQEDALLEKLQQVIDNKNRRAEFEKRRQTMLEDKIDPVPVFGETLRMVANGRSRKEIMNSPYFRRTNQNNVGP
ncbi:MAG: hypothetical protein HN348_21145 [Proteobacteria bacterium]|jgi:uncharacterized protein|nr:hypothetical protein [Pseudomonadota bacterium]